MPLEKGVESEFIPHSSDENAAPTDRQIFDDSVIREFENDPFFETESERQVNESISQLKKLKFKTQKYIENEKSHYPLYRFEIIYSSTKQDYPVWVIGNYKHDLSRHYLVELKTLKKVNLDMSGVKEYPEINSYVEIFGNIILHNKELEVAVHFFGSLGFDENEVYEYLEQVIATKQQTI